MSAGMQLGKVLIVDDDPACLAMLDLALQSLPQFAVISAESAEKALPILETERVCAVITDLQLPRMTGVEMISWIRKQPRLHALPIVVTSAAVDPAAPSQALTAGASAYFAKPFSPIAVRNRLRDLVQEYLDRRKGNARDA